MLSICASKESINVINAFCVLHGFTKSESELITATGSMIKRVCNLAEEIDKIPLLTFLCCRPEKSPVYGVLDISKLPIEHPDAHKRNTDEATFKNGLTGTVLIHVHNHHCSVLKDLAHDMLKVELHVPIYRWLT
ncbi:MAG: hypothetical protein J6K43_16275 [Lachnospiraceae bacterium]|nr:hypothetical protein [Lachnospiraceae bacterium]